MVLRTEKGYLHVGGDTDGTTNALDVGFAGIVAKKQVDFVGKRSLLRAEDQRKDRRQLVGMEPLNDNENLEPGAHFRHVARRRSPQPGHGDIGLFQPDIESGHRSRSA